MGIKEIAMVGAILVVAILIAGIVTGGFMGKGGSDDITGNVVAANTGGPAQEVILSFANYGYVVNPPSVNAGQPVRMIADVDSLVGCMSAVRIPKLGVSKNVRTGDNIIEFTPNSPGTYQITCSMGMGTGELIVK